jgi:hypothetical protein
VSSELPRTIVDTVVLMYFLLTGEEDLLFNRVGRPLAVPRIVYDPDEDADIPAAARSEMTRSVAFHQRAARDPARDHAARLQATQNSNRLLTVHALHRAGHVVVFDLDEDELGLVSSLTSPSGCHAFGLKFPLDAGEAACLTMAVGRDLVLATDDADALKALRSIDVKHPYQRIRKLLIGAVESGCLSMDRANTIHSEMRRLGFWDAERPFG